MNIFSPILSTALLVLVSSSAEAGICGSQKIRTTESLENGIVDLYLDRDALFNSPQWRSTEQEPPLSISNASRLALDWAQGHYRRYDRVEIDKISIESSTCNNTRDAAWYYIFEFVPVIEGSRLYGVGNWAIVLTDGSVYGPVQNRKVGSKANPERDGIPDE